VIVSEGNNDFGIPGLIHNPSEEVTADDVIQAQRQIIDRAHALGLMIYGCTLNPIEGILFPDFYSASLEAKRQAVNQWIRTSHAYDAVIDFDRVLRDPSHPTRILPGYDSGEHGHPNDAGYAALADAIDLALFREDKD
jgi:lysophospholipase L1-like esterase